MQHIVGTLEVGFPVLPPPYARASALESHSFYTECEKMALLLYRSQRAVSMLLACPKEKRPRE